MPVGQERKGRQPHELGRFAHNSERELARLFDHFGIEWEYEPIEFVFERNEDGRTTRAFRPDFYLPDENLFIELTTGKQDYTTKKNAKVRDLKQQYSRVGIKILYIRDYLHLMAEYGLEHPEHLDPEDFDFPAPGEFPEPSEVFDIKEFIEGLKAS